MSLAGQSLNSTSPAPSTSNSSDKTSDNKSENKKKRHHKEGAHKDDNEQGQAKKHKPKHEEPKKYPPPPKFPKNEELHCIVCFDFPEDGEILQCKNGHFMCRECHERVLDISKAQCPSCRIRLSRDNPMRNRFAERVLSAVIVPCDHEGCEQKMKFSNLKIHATTECPHRPAICKFAPLGCDWAGFANGRKPHEKTCEIRKKSPSKLLKLVQKRNQQTEEKRAAAQANFKVSAQITKAISGRSKDIVIRDVVIEKDHIADLMCSKTFTGLGLAWEAVLAEKQQPSGGEKVYGLFFRVVSSVKRKLPIQVFLLGGPNLGFALKASIHKIMFKRKKKKSSVLPLPFTKGQMEQLASMDTIHLRIGMIDLTRGRGVSSNFTSLNDYAGLSGGISSDSSDESDSEASDHDHDNLPDGPGDWAPSYDHSDSNRARDPDRPDNPRSNRRGRRAARYLEELAYSAEDSDTHGDYASEASSGDYDRYESGGFGESSDY